MTFAVVKQSLSKHFCPGWAISFYSFGKTDQALGAGVALHSLAFSGISPPSLEYTRHKENPENSSHVVPLIPSSLPRRFVYAFQSLIIFVLYKCPAFLTILSGRNRKRAFSPYFRKQESFAENLNINKE